MNIRIIPLILLICLYSCSGKNRIPDGVLSKPEMQSVLWDIMQADAFAKTYIKKGGAVNDSIENIRLQKQIFAIHHTTKDVFYKSYTYYSSQPEEMRIILDSIILKADKGKSKIERLQRFPASN
jgi:hypothetical protein